ncbi:MAG: Dabb family protein [Paracoccaceae bacterium]
MIRHIVFFSAKNKGDLPKIIAGLRLLQSIPNTLKLEIEPNVLADSLSNEIDVVVYGEFTDQDALDAYKRHPTYQKAIEIVRPLREIRVAADFVSPA